MRPPPLLFLARATTPPPLPLRPVVSSWRRPRTVAQSYVLSTATDDRAPVPSKVLIHYLKEDEPTSAEVSPPVVLKGVATGSSLPPGAYVAADSGALYAEFDMDSMAGGACLSGAGLDGSAGTSGVLGVPPLGDAPLAPAAPPGGSLAAHPMAAHHPMHHPLGHDALRVAYQGYGLDAAHCSPGDSSCSASGGSQPPSSPLFDDGGNLHGLLGLGLPAPLGGGAGGGVDAASPGISQSFLRMACPAGTMASDQEALARISL